MAEAPLTVCIISCPFQSEARRPEALLAAYPTLVGWAEGLVAAGAGAVTVVQRFRSDGFLRRNGVDYRFVLDGRSPEVSPLYLGARVVRAARAARPAVVHVDGLVFPALTRHLRVGLPAATVIVAQDHGGIHAGSPGFGSLRWRMLHRLGLRAADGFLFTAREQAEPWARAGIIGGRQNVYEVLESSTELAARAAIPGNSRGQGLPGHPAILWVGRLDANKDPLTVLDGFERAAADLPGAALTMIFGTDDLIDEVRRKIAAAPRLADRVHLLGRMEHGDLPARYASADLFVLASHHESCGFALVEALSFGVTPVVSDIPAFRVLTDGGRLGAVFPVGDAAALAAALVRLGGEARSGQREAVRAHFDREFSWPAVGRRALQVYGAAVLRKS